jgi:hypothetical protein
MSLQSNAAAGPEKARKRVDTVDIEISDDGSDRQAHGVVRGAMI